MDMQALVYSRYGEPDVLGVATIPMPEPKDDEVRVRVMAASVNSWDLDQLRGRPYFTRLGTGILEPSQHVLGVDIAGTVEAVGSNVMGLNVGDRVFADISNCGWGGFAQFKCVPAPMLAVMPPSMTFEQAAGLGHAASLALQALRKAEVAPGETVLVNGGGGGVGIAAVQIARLMGARVTAVDSDEKLEAMRDAGAEHVIDYRRGDFSAGLRRYDAIIDVVGARSVFRYRRALSEHGRLVLVGGRTGTLLGALLFGQPLSWLSRQRFSILIYRANAADLDELARLFDAGKLTPVLEPAVPLSGAPDAIRRLAEGRVIGKAIIAPNS